MITDKPSLLYKMIGNDKNNTEKYLKNVKNI